MIHFLLQLSTLAISIKILVGDRALVYHLPTDTYVVDVQVLLDAAKFVLSLAQHPPFSDIISAQVFPDPSSLGSDDAIVKYAAREVLLNYSSLIVHTASSGTHQQ